MTSHPIALFSLLALLASSAVCANRARVEVLVIEAGGKAGVRRVTLSRRAAPGPGKELRVLVAPEAEVLASAAAFNKKGELAFDVLEVAVLKAGDKPRELPDGAVWNWNVPDQVSDIYVVLAAPGATDFASYRALVSKMKTNASSPELRKMQAGALLRWIESHLKVPTTAADYSIKAEPTPMGGLIRGTDNVGVPVDVPDGRSVVMRIRLEH
jgi:hypothetical protein